MSCLRLSWWTTQMKLLMGHGFRGGDEECLTFVQRDELSQTYGDEGEASGEGTGASLEHHREDLPAHNAICLGITTWEAGWNVTNAIQGIFVLGLPYALLQSGYLGLLLLILAPVICSYTGKILIACLYEDDENGRPVRIRSTYQDIANACCTRWCPLLGGRLVCAAQVVELTMTCVLYLVVAGNLARHSFPHTLMPAVAWSLGTALVLVPCLRICDLRAVSRLSLLCSLAQFLVTFAVIAYCLAWAPNWSWQRVAVSASLEKFPVSVGVIVFSYTSQIFLPTLEGSMQDPGDFSGMMVWTHALACVFKTAFSVAAFLTWGEETKEVVTDNLPGALRAAVNLCLVVKALLSYPLPFYAAAEVLQGCMAGRAGPLALRGGLLLLTFLMATFVPHFSLLMGLTGSVTGAAMSFLLPSLFHLRLKWTKLNSWFKGLDFLILALGSLCSLSGLICSVKEMMEALGSR